MTTRAFVDTNVFVYLFDGDSPRKQARAREIISREAGAIVLSTQVLQEFYVTVTRKLAVPLDPSDAEEATRDLSAFDVVTVDVPLILRAIALARVSKISMWDALIIESAIDSGCDRLLTEDLQTGQVFGSLLVENPFT